MTEDPTAPKMSRRQTMIGDHPVANAAMMLELFEPGDVIGSGSFGIIRKVVRKADGAILARKELNYRKMEERDLKQLNEEVRILQNMPQNEYIIRYFDRYLDKTNYTLHIVMEFCENGDLTHVISRCKHDKILLPEEMVWSFMTQIAIALADCHSETDAAGQRKAVVLHRDIKPENVFLTKDNIVKLGDFGLSKAMAYAAFTNTYVGTPYYMSPELLQGLQYDVKSDIWAMGCLIYELCAWQPPFAQAQSQPELAKLVREGKIPDLPRGYSTQLAQVVKSMLRQDPKMRPTAKQILGHEQIKLQLKSMKLRKIVEECNRQREELNAREAMLVRRERALAAVAAKEAELAERERNVIYRERQLRLEREQFDEEKERLVTALGGTSLIGQPYSGTTSQTSASSGLGDSLMDDPEDRRPNTSSSINSMTSEHGEIIRRVASRPSLVPRRGPVDDRRSMSQLTHRLSSNSLMSLDELPIKGGNGSPANNIQRSSNLGPTSEKMANTPSNQGRRRITTSRSMYNLNAVQKVVSRQLFPSASKDNLRAISKAQEIANAYPSPAPSNESDRAFFGQHSDSDQVSPSLASMALSPTSPNKRSAAMAFSASQQANLPPSPSSRLAPAPAVQVPAAIYIDPGNVQWDMHDEDSLPSPFLKRKAPTRTMHGLLPAPARAAPQPPTLRSKSSRQTLTIKTAAPVTRSSRNVEEPVPRTLRERRSSQALR